MPVTQLDYWKVPAYTGIAIYISEFLAGFKYVEDGPLGFRPKFVGLSLQWFTVSPAAAIGARWLLVQRGRAEALAEHGIEAGQ